MKIRFLGAAGGVTGSRHLVEQGGTRVLVDCGLFQGVKAMRRRNWDRFPVPPETLDAVLLTHAHIDHSGYLPRLVRDGFRGPIYCTAPSRELCKIMLPDSARLQAEDASYANDEGFSRHQPAEPLYTEDDAAAALDRLEKVRLGEDLEVGALRVRFQGAGHILGAASVRLEGGGTSVLFSGDLGRQDDLLMPPPEPPGEVDHLVMESTYGDRLHEEGDPIELLGEVLKETLRRRGVLLIPAFAVGRTQAMLYALSKLFQGGGVERVPVYVNSPMATSVTHLYQRYHTWNRLDEKGAERLGKGVRFVRSVGESKELNRHQDPKVVISASGMLTGGRILHHVKAFGPRPRNTIFLPGYQAPGTRGGALAAGATELKIHGRYVPIRARVQQVNLFSAHADQAELLAWVGAAARKPRSVVLVHGEPAAADELRRRIEEQHELEVTVPELGDELELA